MGIIKGFFKGLEKTRKEITGRIYEMTKNFRIIDEDFFDGLEEILISGDLGIAVTDEILGHLREEAKAGRIKDKDTLITLLKTRLLQMLSGISGPEIFDMDGRKKIILVVGVNGTGKTTSIGKIAGMCIKKGMKPLIAAADTFRAAAIDQLQIWADRTDVKMINQAEGADPSSVIYDAITYMKSHGNDILLCDTAGRLHNKKNLMNELKKIYATINKNASDADIYTLLVIDASTGQNGVNQARLFKEAANVDGIILTKIDGTAKGGIIFPIAYEIGIPVLFVGMGEKVGDIDIFEPQTFIDELFLA
jgi:fused signal recognition particle receptor